MDDDARLPLDEIAVLKQLCPPLGTSHDTRWRQKEMDEYVKAQYWPNRWHKGEIIDFSVCSSLSLMTEWEQKLNLYGTTTNYLNHADSSIKPDR